MPSITITPTTTTTYDAIENKIPNVSSLVQKKGYGAETKIY